MTEEENLQLKDILRRISNGDNSAIRDFSTLMTPKMKAIVYSVSGSLNDVDDILQEVYVTIWRKKNLIRVEKNLKGWIYQITYSKTIDNYRRKKSFGEVSDFDMLNIKQDFQECQIENVLWLKQAIGKLEFEDRKILVMKYYLGMTLEEIGAQVCRSIAWVHKRLDKIYIILRDS